MTYYIALRISLPLSFSAKAAELKVHCWDMRQIGDVFEPDDFGAMLDPKKETAKVGWKHLRPTALEWLVWIATVYRYHVLSAKGGSYFDRDLVWHQIKLAYFEGSDKNSELRAILSLVLGR
jgi:hypothetical protein